METFTRDSLRACLASSQLIDRYFEEEKDNKMVLHLSVSICKDLLAEIKRAGRNCVAGRGESVDAFWWKNACGDNIPGHVQRIASS